MSFDKNKIFRIIAISIVFLSLMLTFQWYYSRNMVIKALENTLLENKYVDNVEITKQREKITISLTLKDVDNLMEVYNTIYETMEYRLKGQPFELKIINKSDSAIKDLFYNKVQFIIYEALQTGEFNEMRARLDEIQYTETEESKSGPLEIKVFIDSDNLYLQIELDKSGFYEVIKREA